MDIEKALLHEPISSLLLKEPITVPFDASLREAVQTLQERDIGCVLVLDAAGALAGIFTERDLLTKVAGRASDRDAEPVSSFMTSAPETLRPSDPIVWALNYMHQGGYRHVPLIDEAGRLAGVISVRDIVDHLVDLFPAAVLNLPPRPRRVPLTADELGGDA